MDGRLLGQFNKFEKSTNGLRASGSGYSADKITSDQIEYLDVKVEDLHHSVDIKEENSSLEYQQDNSKDFDNTGDNNLPGPSKRMRYTDLNLEETTLKWSEEDYSCDSADEDDDVAGGDFILSEHDSESEIEMEDNENNNITSELDSSNSSGEESSRYYYGKNRFKWSSDPVFGKNTSTPIHNFVSKFPRLKNNSTTASDPLTTWNMLFTNDILDIILQWTNASLAKFRTKSKKNTGSELRDMDVIELQTFLGALLMTSIFKSNNEDIRSIFATDGSGRDIFRCITNASRFARILARLRFDDKNTRAERSQTDPLAAISEIFNIFIKNCQSVYSIGSDACIDEMLVPFRGRCKFKIYMPNKACKYGLKVMALTDAKTGYLLNAYVYTGKGSLSDEEKQYSEPTQSIIRLAKPLFGTNRNITADNWFSSIEAVTLLKTKKLTYVGPLKKSKTEIPVEFLPNKNREVGSSVYGYTKDMTLLSYVHKKYKAVVLISSMHHNESTDLETGKPEIISHYNLTKGGVDAIDEKCTVYSCSRKTRRWPMALFYKMVDIASVNAYVLQKSFRNNTEISRYNFIKQLAMQLITPELQRRFGNPRISRELRMNIGRILRIKEVIEVGEEEKLAVRKTCRICPSSKKRKTSYFCIMCKRPVCLECTRKLCKDCAV